MSKHIDSLNKQVKASLSSTVLQILHTAAIRDVSTYVGGVDPAEVVDYFIKRSREMYLRTKCLFTKRLSHGLVNNRHLS